MSYKKWTSYEINYLKKYYGNESIKDIATKLNRSKDSVFKKAKRLNLTLTVKKWTKEEINYLSEKWGIYSLTHISKKLKRSNVAIRKKAAELQLGPARIGNGSFLTTGDIGYLLNKDPNLIYRWIKDGYIKGRKFGDRKKFFQVLPEDFILFLKKNPQKWNTIQARVELIQGYIYDCYNNPIWFEEKFTTDKKHFLEKRHIYIMDTCQQQNTHII